jgi:hypothetical protein
MAICADEKCFRARAAFPLRLCGLAPFPERIDGCTASRARPTFRAPWLAPAQSRETFKTRLAALRAYTAIARHEETFTRVVGGPLVPFVSHALLRSASEAFREEHEKLPTFRDAEKCERFGVATTKDLEMQ